MNNQAVTITPKGESYLRLLNPISLFRHQIQYRDLVIQLVKREMALRYKGSVLGMAWSLIQPLIMLFVYTFVFSIIFKARWGVNPNESRADFALALFAGMITFNIFSEVVNAAPMLILHNANYVKKVVFPLEILPLVKLLSSLMNALFSLMALFIGFVLTHHYLPWTVLLVPLVWLPVILFSLGWGYFVSSLGVFIRDIDASIPIITTMLFFLTPIFYPASSVPGRFQIFCHLNPLALFVEDARRVLLWEQMPDWKMYGIGLSVSLVIYILGFLWFMKSKKAFVDVI